MCYSGKCKYEVGSWGESAGECTLPLSQILKGKAQMPEDAACIVADREIEEYERNHPATGGQDIEPWD